MTNIERLNKEVQEKLFKISKSDKKILEIELNDDVQIYYNRFLTPRGVVTEQIIKRRII